jgi:aryl-alcohol dehydrogenase-like predicted oxidoreductase
MRYRTLGSSGPEVSVVGLGCNNFGSRVQEDGTREVVDAALESGITLLDTADVYGNRGGSEELLGKALKGRRDRVVLATKFGHAMTDDAPPNRGSREYIRGAIEASLKRLRTDWVDLYQYHRPDGITPIEETLAALDELVREGKVRHVGSSNFDARQVVEADDLARERGWTSFTSAQNQYSLLEREAEQELLPTCERLSIGVLPYFPLASGLLTGKYRRGQPAPAGSRLVTRPERLTADVFDRLDALERFAEERGRSVLELSIGALTAQPAIASVIAGATKADQVRANAAAGDRELSASDLEALHVALDG